MNALIKSALGRFVAAVAVAAGIGLFAGGASAQSRQAQEGFEYKLVKPEQPTEAAKGKIEVVEFFWYGCPHCQAFEPMLKDWVKRLPADVSFRKVHVPFQVQAHQQLYYALESLGKADELNSKVFNAIHNEHNRLDTPESIAAFMAKNGVDKQQFLDAYNSFGVRTKMQRASQLAQGYKIEGVPSVGVAGRYLTAPSMAGSYAATLQLVDQLVDGERKARR